MARFDITKDKKSRNLRTYAKFFCKRGHSKDNNCFRVETNKFSEVLKRRTK